MIYLHVDLTSDWYNWSESTPKLLGLDICVRVTSWSPRHFSISFQLYTWLSISGLTEGGHEVAQGAFFDTVKVNFEWSLSIGYFKAVSTMQGLREDFKGFSDFGPPKGEIPVRDYLTWRDVTEISEEKLEIEKIKAMCPYDLPWRDERKY